MSKTGNEIEKKEYPKYRLLCVCGWCEVNTSKQTNKKNIIIIIKKRLTEEDFDS